MPEPEEEEQVFIVRLRLERFEQVERLPMLRGVVEHVNFGTRRYIVNLKELKDYVEKELREMEWKWEK